MKQFKKEIIFLSLAVMAVCSAIAFTISAWSEPGQTPPAGNVGAPVNTGQAAQIRLGALGFGDANLANGNAPYYIIESGGNFQLIPNNPANTPALVVDRAGNVGVGATPVFDASRSGKQLNVNGFVNGQSGLCIGKQCCSSWSSCAVLAGCANYNWMQQANPAFVAIASSSDGTKLVAVPGNHGTVYVSADSGATWSPLSGSPSSKWVAVASSADASKFAAVDDAGTMYVSTDSGAPWLRDHSKRWRAVAFSDTRIFGLADSGIFVSSGASDWQSLPGQGYEKWTAFAVSTNGASLAAISRGNIYISTDFGLNWHKSNVGGEWKSVAFSGGGAIAAAGSGVITSADSGATWWFEKTAAGLGWWSITGSSSGGFLAAVDANGGVWTNQ